MKTDFGTAALLCCSTLLAACSGGFEDAEATAWEASTDEASEPSSAEPSATPVAELTTSTGSSLQFFVDDDGSSLVVETGSAAIASVLESPQLIGATAATIFRSTAPEGLALPAALSNSDLESGSSAIALERADEERVVIAVPPPAECASDTAFNAGFCTGDHTCFLNTSAARVLNFGPVLSYRGGICNQSGSTRARLRSRSQPVGSCGAVGAWTTISDLTLGSGGWIKWVQNDTFPGRAFELSKTLGGNADIGHSATLAECVL